jgi:hypothetical protein
MSSVNFLHRAQARRRHAFTRANERRREAVEEKADSGVSAPIGDSIGFGRPAIAQCRCCTIEIPAWSRQGGGRRKEEGQPDDNYGIYGSARYPSCTILR